ncbi:MAG: hypothetical protein JOS17DRAFT_840627 [Linnemannia elongata]|nr:MAG: hypothetical protein JOS17DRAFT_840627 [Linnemannia elongata]
MSGPQHIVGLSLFGPLVLTVATAPANRVRLLLQTQDEIVLNLREESLAHHHRHTSSSSSNIKPYNLTNDDTSKNATEEQEDDDEEPRSIIAPYAQLPYKDMQDCYHRLLEKEGRAALWRGYSVEVIVKPAHVPTAVPAPVAVQEEKEKEGEALAVESSTESISRDSVEWVNHTAEWANHQDQDQDQKDLPEASLSVSESTPPTTTVVATATAEEEKDDDQELSYTTVTYDLSHKYKTYRQIYHEIIASSEGYLGLYKGFSTVIASAFISRLGMMTMYTLKSFCGGPSGTVSISPFQVFLTQTALSVVTYPLTTVGNRRMIAAPGRYTSSWEAAKEIVEKQGWQALFRGVEVVVLRSVVLAAMTQLLL